MLKTLRAFAPSSSEFISFLTCHHSITDFEINAFLNQETSNLVLKLGASGALKNSFDFGVSHLCSNI